MSERPADLAQKIFARLNAHDLDGAMEFVHEDVVDDFVVLRVVSGRERVRAFFEGLFQAFPNFMITPVHIHGDDTFATIQWEASATFSGTHFEGIRPTNRPIHLRGVDVMEFRDGRMIKNTIYYDGAAFARQVGLLPAQDSPPERLMFGAFNKVTELRSRLKI